MLKNIKIFIKRKLRTYRNRILKRINKVIEFFKLKTKGITIESTSYVTRPIYFISIFVLISVIINQKVNKSDDVVLLESELDLATSQVVFLQTHTDELQSQMESSVEYTEGLENDLDIYLSTLSDLKRYNAELEEQLTTEKFLVSDCDIELEQLQKDLDLADAWIKSHIELIEQ
tara:strand:- start:10 stop:531 length:522 start_codon:yes stop_codon:yes gene_type:complete